VRGGRTALHRGGRLSAADHHGTVVLACAQCALPYGVPRALFDDVVARHGYLCCPMAHAQQFGVEPPHERRIRELELALTNLGVMALERSQEIKRLRATVVDQLTAPPGAGSESA